MNKAVKVLLIEDSEDDALLALRMLRRGGFDPTYRRVQDLQSLREALRDEQWDAILSDYRLPGFNGVDALNLCRATGLDVPFIFFSGTIGEETAVAAMKAGASDYVMKHVLARLAPVLERELAQAAIRAQHRQGQIDLEASRDRYVDLYDFAPVGYLSLSAEGLVTQANLTGAALLGAPRDQLTGTPFARFVAPEDLPRWQEHSAQVLRHGITRRLELVLQAGRAGRLHVQVDCMQVAARGEPPVLRITLTDISERKEAEASLRGFEAQLREMQKMESIGTLAGGIAHDFNNILGAILGNVTLAREEVGPGHPALVSLEEIHKASLRARNLVQQILAFSRRAPQELVTQSLAPVVEETRRLLRATLPAGVELEVMLDPAPLHVHADATQLQQVLMNLCTNAWQAMRQGSGRIRIGLSPVSLAAGDHALSGHLAPGPYVHLWVSDNGSGMDAATRERIFEPFFTTKPTGQGTGLGLSVVHGIVTAHHGSITVESTPGCGSTFHLYLPAAAPAPAEPPADALPAEDWRGQGQHVMYVDDDEAMLLVVERILLKAGYRVSACQDPQEALAAVRRQPDSFDLVVTDFNMPGFSGLDVARELATIRPTLPVIISSGYITEELRSEARQAGARGLLEKQNTFQELCVLVGRVFADQTPPPQPLSAAPAPDAPGPRSTPPAGSGPAQ